MIVIETFGGIEVKAEVFAKTEKCNAVQDVIFSNAYDNDPNSQEQVIIMGNLSDTAQHLRAIANWLDSIPQE